MTKILLIGFARGKTEDEVNHGFTGSSGVELSFMLRDADLAHNHNLFCPKCQTWSEYPKCNNCFESLYPSPQDMIRFWQEVKENYSFEITNVFEEHPPNNDLGHFFSTTKDTSFLPGLKYDPKRPISYLLPQYEHHLTTLYSRIKDTKPNLCLLLGNVASWAVLKQTQIKKIRGFITQSDFLGVKCLPTWHPANILRDYSNRPIVLADFKKAKTESEFPEVRRVKRKVIYHATLDEIRFWLNLPADRYTVDIESGYALFTNSELQNMTQKMRYTLSSQISMIGFERDKGKDSLVIEFMTRNKPNLSYWDDLNDEITAWELAQLGLSRSIPKTFQNGLYDATRLLYAGIKINSMRDDTMLLHHSLYPEMEKSLGFLGSLYSNEQAWKLMYSKGESLKHEE